MTRMISPAEGSSNLIYVINSSFMNLLRRTIPRMLAGSGLPDGKFLRANAWIRQ